MTRKWAESNRKVKFYSMHPGWADTPGVCVCVCGGCGGGCLHACVLEESHKYQSDSNLAIQLVFLSSVLTCKLILTCTWLVP